MASQKKKKKMLSKLAKDKASFRRSDAWRSFRKQKMLEQKGLDLISRRRLVKSFHCHHVLQTTDMNVYTDLSDLNNFVAVNSATHDALHYALNLIRYNSVEAWYRFIDEVEREAIMNEYMDEYEKR